MNRTPLIGAVAAGLMMTGILVPAAANAATPGPNAAVAATAPAPSNANPVPAGSSLGPIPIAQSLLFLPTVLGVGSNRHFSEALQQQGGGNGEISQQSHS